MKFRDFDQEFRLLRRLTETKEHTQNQIEIDKKKSRLLNRYSDLRPFKHTHVSLPLRNEDTYDSYINANFINSCIGKNDKKFIAA